MKRFIQYTVAILVPIMIAAIILAIVPSVWAAPQADPGINKVYITNVRDSTFDVTWTTEVASDGSVTYDTSTPPSNTLADAVTNTTTHFVTLTGLNPTTTYFFSVTSDTATDDNGGAYYQVTTGATLGIPPAGKTIYGVLNDPSGAPLPNAIVYLQLQDGDGSGSPGNSQWGTVRTEENGYWSYNMGNLRTEDLSDYFTYSTDTDNLRIDYQCGNLGNVGENGAEVILPISSADPWDTGVAQCDEVPNAVTVNSINSKGASFNPWLLLIAFAGVLFASVLIILRKRTQDQV